MTHQSDRRGRPRAQRAAASARIVAPVAGALVALVAAGVLVAAVVPVAGARFSGSTDSTGSLLQAAAVDLVVGADAEPATTALAIDASNLVPGDAVQRCITVAYRGSATDVDVRLLGRHDGGSGLESFLRVQVESGTGAEPGCADFVPDVTLLDGLLATTWNDHGTFASGLPVLVGVDDGGTTTLRITLELLDDDRAQGRDTGFWLVLEARP